MTNEQWTYACWTMFALQWRTIGEYDADKRRIVARMRRPEYDVDLGLHHGRLVCRVVVLRAEHRAEQRLLI